VCRVAGGSGHGASRAVAVVGTGTGSPSTGGLAAVDSVSCGSEGDCLADGYNTDLSRDALQFVASERNRHLAQRDRGARRGVLPI
jgi:hypothetical protein